MKTTQQRLLKIFNILLAKFGKRHWWPGETPLEIVVGAILTQNTAWKNVERAIANMKQSGILDIKKLYEIDENRLGKIIRPAGFFRIKAKRLKSFIQVLCEEYGGTLKSLAKMNTGELRNTLLDIHGIGHETADSIILYAFHKPIFVIDAYTKRFLKNHCLYNGGEDYNKVQKYFMDNLPSDTYLFNEFHALIVYLCQMFCKKVTLCNECPLKNDKDSASHPLAFGFSFGQKLNSHYANR